MPAGKQAKLTSFDPLERDLGAVIHDGIEKNLSFAMEEMAELLPKLPAFSIRLNVHTSQGLGLTNGAAVPLTEATQSF